MRRFIRSAISTDVPRLLELEQVFPNSMTEPMLLRELEVGRGYVYLESQAILGYALVRQDGRLLDLTRLAVDMFEQGKGIGGQLLDAVLAEGRTTVLTVKKDNAHALRLYHGRGFKIVGHFKQENAWVMRRDAAAPAPDGCRGNG